MGIASHLQFFHHLKQRRRHLLDLRLLHGATHYNPTPTFVVAALLLALELIALVSVTFRVFQ